MKKYTQIVALVVLIVLIISGCSTSETRRSRRSERDDREESIEDTVKSDEEIQSDLEDHPDFFSVQEVGIDNFEITGRQTNENQMTDTVYVTVDASNDYINCNLQYEMLYEMYNDGWRLESVTPYARDEWSIIPLQGPSYDYAYVFLQNNTQFPGSDYCHYSYVGPQPSYNYTGGDCEFWEENDDYYCDYYFHRTENYDFATLEITDVLHLTFDESSAEWVGYSSSTVFYESYVDFKYDVIVNWDLDGEYQYIEREYFNSMDDYHIYISTVGNNVVHVTVMQDGYSDPRFDQNMTLDSLCNGDYSLGHVLISPSTVSYAMGSFERISNSTPAQTNYSDTDATSYIDHLVWYYSDDGVYDNFEQIELNIVTTDAGDSYTWHFWYEYYLNGELVYTSDEWTDSGHWIEAYYSPSHDPDATINENGYLIAGEYRCVMYDLDGNVLADSTCTVTNS